MWDLLLPVVSGSLSIVGLTLSIFWYRFGRRSRAKERSEKQEKSYRERLADLMASLRRASREVDSILAELAEVARTRESAIQALEVGVKELESRETELQNTIDVLEKTALPVAEHFAELIDYREKRSRRRDYILFGAGVSVTTVIGIIIQLVAG